MKIFIPVFYVLLSIPALFAQESKDIKIIFPANRGVKVFKWEKLELGIVLPESIAAPVRNFVSDNDEKNKLNPFDPDQLSIEAEFQYVQKSNELTAINRVFGFYYEEYRRKQEDLYPDKWSWVAKRNDYPMRVRFAPGKTGTWKCHVKIITNKSDVTDLGEITFECIESAYKGQVQLTSEQDLRHRYLQFSEKKEMFFPVGLNLVWSRLDELKVRDHDIYKGWFDQLGNAGANYVQLSSLPFTYGVEQEKLNNYTKRLTNAWEFDELLEMARQKGIYVNLLLLIHDEFGTGAGWIHKNNHWTNNPYNSEKNGGMTNAKGPGDFFTDEKCKDYFKKRLRYILSRYGYSTNLPVLELLSEVDNAIPGYKDNSAIRTKFKEWFSEMKNYIQKDLGYEGKLVSVSYTQNDQADDITNGVFPLADIILLHFYGRDKYTNFKNRYTENIVAFKSNPLTRYKPIIFDEMGANVYPTLDKNTDIAFHNSLWATALMGSFGTGQSWWWDNALLPNGSEVNFKGIKKFLSDENFTLTEFNSTGLADNSSKFKNKTAYETYFLTAKDGTKVVGWVHSTSFYWANQKNTNPGIAKLIEDNNGKSIDAGDASQYKKDAERGKATGSPLAKPGQKISLQLTPSTEYIVKWYNTVTGEPNGITQNVKSTSSGKLKFDIPPIDVATNTYGDIGFKVVKFSR
jgi:hypothetical protein